MAWTAPTTRATGDLITASIWNVDVVDNLSFLGQAIGSFAAKASVSQTIVTATWTKLELSSEDWDVSAWYDNATNYRYTPLVAGYYRFNAGLRFTASLGDNNRLAVALYKNGAVFKYLHFDYQAGTDDNMIVTGTCVANANGSSDYFEAWGYHAAGADRLTTGETYFQGELIGTA